MKTHTKTQDKPAPDGSMRALSESVFVIRQQLMNAMGKSFDGKRDLYAACGYPRQLFYADLEQRYLRQEVAFRVVNAFPDATWRRNPLVYETSKQPKSPFEKAWAALTKDRRLKLFTNLKRVDRLSGIGYYGCLFLGFDDGKPLDQPCTKASKLLYVQAYPESATQITRWETDATNPRYGQPLIYNLSMVSISGVARSGSITKPVHWTRILHVAENSFDDIYGIPRMMPIYNRLVDIETTMGGASEAFWRTGFPGVALVTQDGVDLTADGKKALQSEIDEYVHGLRRMLRLKGVEPKPMPGAGANTDPRGHVESEMQLISCGSGIPLRILTGSERGELASSQDNENFESRVEERQGDHAETCILGPLIARLQLVGVLPPTKEDPRIDWPRQENLSENQRLTNAKLKLDMLASYTTGGVEAVLELIHLYTDFLGYTEDDAEEMVKSLMAKNAEEQALAEEDAAKAAAAEALAAGAGKPGQAPGKALPLAGKPPAAGRRPVGRGA